MRAIIVAAAVVLLTLAGCEEMTEKPEPAPEPSTPAPELPPEPSPEPDTAPSFAGTVANQSYTEGEAITPLTLPSASGGEGPLTYSLHPTPPAPGLMFDPATRVLSGTPTTAGTYAVDYRVEDGDANTAASASLSFTITVAPVPACPAHSATRIVGDWDASGAHAMDDEVYSFRADGTYQNTWSTSSPEPGLDRAIITRTRTVNGSYSYVAATCTLTWSPEIANLDRFVAWDGPDQFCTRFSETGFCITTYTRRPSDPPEPPPPPPEPCPAHSVTQIVGDWIVDGGLAFPSEPFAKFPRQRELETGQADRG